MTLPLERVKVGGALAWCSGRAQGNVGDHVGDDPARVEANRRTLAREAGLPSPDAWVWLRQVHGNAVHIAEGPTGEPPPEADAAVTVARGLPLAIVTADCAPVVIATENALAVVHAGHPGLAAGVIEAAVARLHELDRGPVSAFLGPCIHPARYEFGVEDLRALVARLGPHVESRTHDDRPAFDVPTAVKIALERAGVDSFTDANECTSASDEYFSYRRDGATGRQATIAVLV
ncbi:MAG TPA: polyphenol oxidase family protein [Acidimicrobiia bacterium]|nr:polyphenol oxidase family protein [Acidimicrobiia bacterium]